MPQKHKLSAQNRSAILVRSNFLVSDIHRKGEQNNKLL